MEDVKEERRDVGGLQLEEELFALFFRKEVIAEGGALAAAISVRDESKTVNQGETVGEER